MNSIGNTNEDILRNEIARLEAELGLTDQRIQNAVNSEKNSLNRIINELNAKIQQQEQLSFNKKDEYERNLAKKDRIIIGRLADDYAKYVNEEIVPGRKRWEEFTLISFFILLITVILTIQVVIFLQNLNKDALPSLFALDVLLISLLWFCVNQYSYYTKLYTEYSNRKVVAASYIAMLDQEFNSDVKRAASEIIMNTLFSRSSVELGSELPIKEVQKILSRLIKVKGE